MTLRESDMGVKWWYWVLLGLGFVLLVGGVVYGFVSGQFAG